MPVKGRYYDGRTSRPYQVEFDVIAGNAQLRGEVSRACPVMQLRVSEKMRHINRRITFPDGAFIEVDNHPALDQLLALHGHAESWVSRMQQSWRAVIFAALATIAAASGAYLYGIPAVAASMAKILPYEIEHRLGREALLVLDQRWFSPSTLSAEKQKQIVENFQRMQTAVDHPPRYEILFRKSRIGPNAFALPAGKIVMTDELVGLLDDEDAINAVLAHELGHLHERHLTQRVIQGSLVGAASAALFGDVSSSLTALPTLLADLQYSRDAEREADNFAARMLQANGVAPSKLALVFQKMEKASSGPPPYLSTHPPAAERIERLQQLP